MLFFKKRRERAAARKAEQEKQDSEIRLLPFDSGDNDHIQNIISEFRKPWIDDTFSPWRTNNDWDFLQKVHLNAAIARSLGLRESLAVTDKFRLDWSGMEDNSNKELIEKETNFLFSTRHFQLKWYCSIQWLSIQSGLEGSFVDYKKIRDWWCPTKVFHIDNRRFKYYINPNTSDLKSPRLLGIRDGLSMEARALSDAERANMIISIYKPYEYTFGYGCGDFNKIYFLWRFMAFLDELIQFFSEKFLYPWIGISISSMSAATGGSSAGDTLQTILNRYQTQFQDMRAGGIFTVPVSADLHIIDIGKGKLSDMISLHKHLQKIAADTILGAGEAQLSSSKSYGANRSQSQLALQFIYDDREYLEAKMQLLYNRLFELNKPKWAELGVNSIYDLPTIKFVYDNPDTMFELKKFEALQSAGFEIEGEEIERTLDTVLARDPNGDFIRKAEEGKGMPQQMPQIDTMGGE